MRKDNYYCLKRIQDVFLSSLAVSFLSPMFVIICIAIKVDDPNGSPIYKQTRVGLNGKTFPMLKFRSMHKGAHKQLDKLQYRNEADGPVFKIKDDPRITRVGKFLRKTSMDELPQLYNIILGNMSIVGPRPALPGEVIHYTKEQMKRLSIIPGLTCYWQVSPGRHDMSFDDWVDLDLKYIEDQSFITDWKLILKTISVMLKMGGV